MKFDDLDLRMRAFEAIADEPIATGGQLLARLDGRGFTKLTKQRLELQKPFDPRFRDAMLATTRQLMHAGLAVVYAYTQSDEISLWFAPNEDCFGRKPRKHGVNVAIVVVVTYPDVLESCFFNFLRELG